MTAFVPGLTLSEAFYREAVWPLLPDDLPHSAALIGSGSEVLGFDDSMSRDHSWGPKVQLFVRQEPEGLREHLARTLPPEFRGYPTNFTPAEDGNPVMEPHTDGPISHQVRFTTPERFFQRLLALDIDREIDHRTWLSFPSQRLRAATSGAVFRDDLGLEAIRTRLAWYPRDVWLCLMAANWQRIGQEEHLRARAAFVGDDLGAQLIAARLVRDVMRLVFLMEREYAPYPKWFGSAFGRLGPAGRLKPALEGALAGREESVCESLEEVARMHNALDLTAPLDAGCRRFHSRPFRVIDGDRFATALIEAIDDPDLKDPRVVGGIDSLSDNTDLLEDPAYARAILGVRRPR